MKRTAGHSPVRLCVGCNGRDARSAMERFTLVAGRLVRDRGLGRGAYLHPREECRAGFLARKPLVRSLRASVGRAERARFLADGASESASTK